MSKRIVITAQELIDFGLGSLTELNIRYRLISEDRNRISAWTSIFEVPNP